MAKPITDLSIREVASQLGSSVSVVRRWMWKLDILPVARVEREYQTAKGRRVGQTSLYRPVDMERVRTSLKRRSA